MEPEAGAIELRGLGGGAIAERNEEINRRRLSQRATAGGPLRVTDPAALARLMADMKAKAEEQRAMEEAREAERREREGTAYRTPQQRAEAAKAAREAAAAGQAEGEDARVLEKRFDPSRDYYQLLGIPRGASSADVRRAYKKLALLYHPDKHKAEGAEQQAAIQDKFKQVVEAFDVLSDEEQRRVYDKVRDYQESNPGRGLPVLSPEEAALMRSGIAELSRLRRMNAKAVKHKPLEKEVFVSLEKLNAGCTKTVPVDRHRVRPDGVEFVSTKNIHCIIRRGSREGDRLVFEADGEEAVDTLPGDLVLVLRQKPHPVFRRLGLKDLEVFGGSVPPQDLLFAVEVPTLQGRKLLLTDSAFREAAANGGAGGLWQRELPGLGLYDAADPWEKPAGHLRVTLRYPAWLLGEACIHSSLSPQPVHLLGSANDVVCAALAAGSIARMLLHRREAAEMVQAGGTFCSSTTSSSAGGSWQDADSSMASQGGSGSGSGASSRRDSSDGVQASTCGSCCSASMASSISTCNSYARARAVCLVAAPAAPSCPGKCSTDAGLCSPAAAALLTALQKRIHGVRVQTVLSACPLDEDLLALSHADIIILDMGSAAAQQGTSADPGAEEQRVMDAWQQLQESGMWELLWQRFFAGCLMAAVGQGCALLGRPPTPAPQQGSRSSDTPAILPWYAIRAGGGQEGWATLHAALRQAAKAAQPVPALSPVGVGVMAGGCWLAHPYNGRADMLVAPCRNVLVATAAWNACPGNAPDQAGLQEAEDADWGYFCEMCPSQ